MEAQKVVGARIAGDVSNQLVVKSRGQRDVPGYRPFKSRIMHFSTTVVPSEEDSNGKIPSAGKMLVKRGVVLDRMGHNECKSQRATCSRAEVHRRLREPALRRSLDRVTSRSTFQSANPIENQLHWNPSRPPSHRRTPCTFIVRVPGQISRTELESAPLLSTPQAHSNCPPVSTALPLAIARPSQPRNQSQPRSDRWRTTRSGPREPE